MILTTYSQENMMSRLHELDYASLRTVEAAMNADRAMRACKSFTGYRVDTQSGVVRSADGEDCYLAQHRQGDRWFGCTCPDVATHLTNLDRLITSRAKDARLPEAEHMRSRCQCKHHHMRQLAAGIPVFVYLGSERWRVTLSPSGKPFYHKSFIGRRSCTPMQPIAF